MRKALVVGIDYYTHISRLHGCVNDAHAMKGVLEQHSDGSVNFGMLLLTASTADTVITRAQLKDRIQQLFADDSEIALLYFAGHGHIEATGGYLCGGDCRRGDDGLALVEVLTLANESPARNKVIVLDSCHSGVAGNPGGHQTAELSEGMTILTASTQDQYASEENGSGVFTTLFVDAMSGAASNLVGDITPGSVYAHIDQSLGPWKQRPVFKTNVKSFVSLRRVQAPIALAELQQLTSFFPEPGFEFRLDPSFEPEFRGRPDGAPPPNPENTAKFAVLQNYNRVNLVKPEGAPHMWHAAIEAKSCKLTVLGEHYRRLVEQKLI
jgi:Caspase domain